MLGAAKAHSFRACSEEVATALKPDRMKSVAGLVVDLLHAGLRMLIYEGGLC